MALVIKDGKVVEKHLTANIDEIKKALEKNKNFDIQKVLNKASKVKIDRRIVA
jgi:hypothetical protein